MVLFCFVLFQDSGPDRSGAAGTLCSFTDVSPPMSACDWSHLKCTAVGERTQKLKNGACPGVREDQVASWGFP